MIPLARHIELLLLEHDCVIVPGLGGFIVNHVPSRYSEDNENLFLPPYRTVGFNQQLQVNDGLLIQSYMMAYDTSYPAANLQMEHDVEQMMYQLEVEGEYVLANVGVMKKGLNSNITFVAEEVGVLAPSLYGLYSFEMKPLQSVIKAREIEKGMQVASIIPLPHHDETTDKSACEHKEITLRVNRRWLDFGISVAAAVALLFCVSYSAMKNINNEIDTVAATFSPIDKPIVKPVPASKKAEILPVKKVEQQASNTENTEKSQTTKQKDVTEEKADEAKFAIVLASYVSQHNAEGFISNLAKKGFPKGRYTKVGNVSRILYSTYPNEAEAYDALKSLRQQSSVFKEAWVLAL